MSAQTTKTSPPLCAENPREINVSEMVAGEHRWFGMKLAQGVVPACRWCGVIRRRDGANKPCPGLRQRVALRLEDQAA